MCVQTGSLATGERGGRVASPPCRAFAAALAGGLRHHSALPWVHASMAGAAVLVVGARWPEQAKRVPLERPVMKVGKVQDSGNGAVPYLEVDGWTPWQYYVAEEELEPYYRAANALMMKLERMPATVRARLERIEIRCPAKGCLLATVYSMPRRPTVEELEHERRVSSHRGASSSPASQPVLWLYVGRTADGTKVYDIVDYPFDSVECSNACILYWRAGCRHGTASINRAGIDEMFAVAGRWHHALETEDAAVARLPEHLRPFWSKRVFHPGSSAWHAKRRQPRPVASWPRSKDGAPVLRKGV